MRALTKVVLGMAASYFLLTKPKRSFAELSVEFAKLPGLFLKKTLSLTFLGFAFTLLIVGGIVMLFYDIGFYYNINKAFGISSVGVSSLALVTISLAVILILLKPKRFQSSGWVNGHQDAVPSLSERIVDLLYDNWRDKKSTSNRPNAQPESQLT